MAADLRGRRRRTSSGHRPPRSQAAEHHDLQRQAELCRRRSRYSISVLAKIKSGELLGSFIQAQTTGLMGSPYYMAPEQWADDEPDSRSDIYSLGVMLFQMLAGDVPFKGSSIPAIMKKHISDPPPTFAEAGCEALARARGRGPAHASEDNDRRTTSVEKLDAGIAAGDQAELGIHTTSGGVAAGLIAAG